jgi:HK97 family phage prohead protease
MLEENKKLEDDCITVKIERKNSFNLKGDITIPPQCLLKEDGRRIIAGYASIVEIDLADDLITEEALRYGLSKLIEDERYANIMLSHTDIQIGHILKDYNGLTTHVDDKGLFIIAELRKGFKYADMIWDEILNGEINAFSIGGYVEEGGEERVCDGDKCWNQINKISLFEVSVCEYPCNVKSGFIILNKNKDNVNDNVENNVNDKNLGDEMPEKKEEAIEETKEENLEDEINPLDELSKGFESLTKDVSGIVRRMEALEKVVQDIITPKEESDTEAEDELPEEKSDDELDADVEEKSDEELPEEKSEHDEDCDCEDCDKPEEVEKECEDCKASKEEPAVEESEIDETEIEKSEESDEIDKVEKSEDDVEESKEEDLVAKSEEEVEEESDSDDELVIMKKSIEDRDEFIKSMEKKISELEAKISELEEEEQPKKTKVPVKDDYRKCDEKEIVVKNGEVYYK